MTSAPDAGNVLFISHNAADQPYAAALESVVKKLVDDLTLIDVAYSTSNRTGPEGGESWRHWIYDAVVRARTTLIVVTPHALGKPWLLWEAGAVKGAALARAPAAGTGRRAKGASAEPAKSLIVSLAFGLPNNECPDPLRGEQIVQGTDIARLKELFPRILEAHGVSGAALMTAGARMEKAFEDYRRDVEAAMRRTPSLVNEANVQDWLTRLDTLASERRLSELPGFERWMMLAFGHAAEPGDGGFAVPIDLRLHRRLGELYLGERRYADAVRQLRLAWRSAPRNIFIVRPLAEACMKQLLAGGAAAGDDARRDEIRVLLDAIRDLDPQAYTANPDAAALLAKYYRRVLGKPDQALDVYREVLAVNRSSYYLADLAGQTALELGQLDEARQHFALALEIIGSLHERSIWSHATAATASVALSDLEGAREHLSQVRLVGSPTQTEIDSIGRGLREVASRAGVADERVDELLHALDPPGVIGG